MYEDEFELTFNLSGEEPQPEQAAQEPPVPPKPKAAAPVVDEPTRVMVLEKSQPAPQPEMPEPVQEEPEKTPAPAVHTAANGRCVLISGGDRGIAALCEPLHWGPTAKVIEIDAGADMTVYTGYDITAPENRFLTEIFKGTNRTAAPRKVLLYRPTASGAVKATMEIAPLTATAKYVGVRGNDISVVVTALSSPEGSFEVSTVVDGEIKDQQTAKTVEELAANSWVDWSGTGALM